MSSRISSRSEIPEKKSGLKIRKNSGVVQIAEAEHIGIRLNAGTAAPNGNAGIEHYQRKVKGDLMFEKKQILFLIAVLVSFNEIYRRGN
jgi:hypothetical protein